MATNAPLIRRLRTDAGLTTPELATKAGVDRTYLHRIEHGQANPSYRLLGSIAAALNVPVLALWLPDLTAEVAA